MADLRHKKHLFFDLDDTLWDFQKNSGIVLAQLFEEFELATKLNTDYAVFLQTYKRINLEFWSKYYTKQIDKHYLRNHRFNETFKAFGYDNYEENLVITSQYLDRAPRETHLKEGCIEVLDYLKHKYQLHIITNGFLEVQHIKLDGSGLRNYFNQIIISEEHQLVKPEEKIFRLAEFLAGAEKNDCVMIGDSFESDITGAINAGWEAIHLNENQKDVAVKNIKHLTELKQIF
jgi:putative hydrolase of the HAD superfamily